MGSYMKEMNKKSVTVQIGSGSEREIEVGGNNSQHCFFYINGSHNLNMG